jgi:heat shock protein HslJ
LTAGSLVALAAAVLVGCAAGSDDGKAVRVRAPGPVIDRVWHWTGTVTPTETIDSSAPERYTLELAPNGRLLVRADCNRGTGSYRIGKGTIALGPIATTRRACPPGSLDARYLADLQRAAAFFVEDGRLHLALPADAGTMRFAPRQ